MILRRYEELDKYMKGRVLLVCDDSIGLLKIGKYFSGRSNIVKFSNFVPNPLLESVVEGVSLFRREKCDTIVAVGGGSAIDVAKCIKLFSNMNAEENYLNQVIVPNDVPLIAIPTTAGTGSEATRYAVIYYNGVKQSISDYSCIPSVVLLDDSTIDTLPLYQKKSTMMDALCHSIESFWSINSTEESKEYSKEAIRMIIANYEAYVAGDNSRNGLMLKAANLAGKAINITQTTAGHAMSYKITSLYTIAHGHAVALCLKSIWPFMVEHIDKCIDCRGIDYLKKTFHEIAIELGCCSVDEAIGKFCRMVDEMELFVPQNVNAEDFSILKKSVNIERLKNTPITLTEEDIDFIYHGALGRI